MKQVLEYVTSFVTIALVLAGIGGVSYHMFKENGWLGLILGKVWNLQVANPVIAIPVTIGVLFLGKLWYDHNRAKGHTSKLPDVVIYVVMAVGAFFIYRLVVKGTL